jgi:hypothetical protein
LVLDKLGDVFGECIENLNVLRNALRVTLGIAGKAIGHGNENILDIHSRLKLSASVQEWLQSLKEK